MPENLNKFIVISGHKLKKSLLVLLIMMGMVKIR